MREANLNHDLVALFKGTGHFAYKIPDAGYSEVLTSSKRPLDGFARFSEPVNDFWFESKLIKNKIGAFSLRRVEEHQYESLLRIKRSGGFTALIVGVWIPRQDYWFMCFDPEFLRDLANQGKKSLTKKELTDYRGRGYTISLRSKDLMKFSPEMLRDRIIDFLPGGEAGIGKVQG